VGGALAIAGGILVGKSRRALKEIDPIPKNTVATLKENVQWAKDQMK